MLDSKLTFVPHIDNVVKKASKMLGFLIRNVKSFRSPNTKIVLYNSLVRSLLEYCVVAWRPHYATHSLRIERIQKRFMYHLAYSTGVAKKQPSYLKRLNHFKMDSLEKRRNSSDLLFLFKLLHNNIDCPELLSKFNFNIPRKYPRKPIMLLYPPFRRSVLGTNSPVSRLSKLYNHYSEQIDIFGTTFPHFRSQVHNLTFDLPPASRRAF